MRSPSSAGATTPYLFVLLGLLWLAGAGMRIPLLAIPPLLPSIHDDLHLTETQVGALSGLPLFLFGLAAVPGSLLIARLGASVTAILGLAVLSIAAAARGAAIDVWTLYLATTVMGIGIAVVQPAAPQLVREWMPERIVLGTATYTNGMLIGTTVAAAMTISFVLPLVGQSWRWGLVVWSAPGLLAALLLYQLGPSAVQAETPTAGERLWWPDWKGALTWLLGLTFGCNNSIYFAANAFLPDYLNYQGRPDLIGSALGWLNGAQILASFVLLAMAERLQRRAWPFLIFGTTSIIALLAMATTEGAWIVAAAGLFGFAIAVTFVVLLALPALLSRPQDVHRTAAGMFTISYCFSVTVPIASGAFWDLTGLPWTAFVPLVTAAGALTVLGAFLSRHKHG